MDRNALYLNRGDGQTDIYIYQSSMKTIVWNVIVCKIYHKKNFSKKKRAWSFYLFKSPFESLSKEPLSSCKSCSLLL